MTEYDNTNRGVLFQNFRKDSDNQPDYKKREQERQHVFVFGCE